jgi:hypothetical protein
LIDLMLTIRDLDRGFRLDDRSICCLQYR